MTLFIHKLVDFLDKNGVPFDGQKVVYRLIKTAVCFDFGELPLERNDLGQMVIPNLTGQEIGFIRDGYVPFPAPIVWFEFTSSTPPYSRKGQRTALLGFDGSRFHPMLDGVQALRPMVTRIDWQDGDTLVDGVFSKWEYVYHNGLPDIAAGVSSLDSAVLNAVKKMGDAEIHSSYLNNIPLFLYLNLMINSKTTELKPSPAPDVKLNKARAKRGRFPLKEHSIVTIVPNRFITAGPDQGGTHASPRLHWRRSHLRTLADGKKIIIPRHLVGRRELGEITSEYRVKLDAPHQGRM